jgi:hypothetical protein
MTRGNGTRRIPPLFLFMTLLTCAAAEPVAESLAPDTITTNTLAMLPAQKASALDLPQAVTTDSAIPVAASITGADLLRQYARLDKVAVVDGVYYQDIHKGTGNSPKRGQIVYFMIKAYAADGGELAIGDTNHSHPEGASPVHTHANPGYRSRWIFFGDGGGSFSLGTREMDQLFSQDHRRHAGNGNQACLYPITEGVRVAGLRGPRVQGLGQHGSRVSHQPRAGRRSRERGGTGT